MSRAIVALIILTLVAGCGPNKAERAAKFVARCDKAGFTVPQCALLFEMVEKAAADADDAALVGSSAAAFFAGAGAGVRR